VSKPTFGLEVIRGATLFVAVSATIAAAQPAGPVRQFAPGAFNWPDQLPPGRFRSQIERLPQPARDRAIQWLRSFHFTDADTEMLNTDPEGGVFYADTFETPAETQEAEPETGGAPVPVSPFPEHLIFHSKPGAPNVLYLNFCGENVTGTAWNNTLNRTVIPALPFSTDTDYSAFSDSEQLAIKRIWLRVAEDFAPFDIDVTTERPAVFNSRTAHVLITRNTDANGADNPSSSAGGVAYVNVFAGGNYAYYRPAWVYHNKLSNSEANIAEAASHEAGHNLGLSHDGKTDGAQYYGGHGSGEISWGPIMGTGYGRNVSQWSKGEYYLANNTQDDLAIIAGKIAYRADDHGNTAFTATPLVLTGGTNIVSTTPDNDPWNTNPANKGVPGIWKRHGRILVHLGQRPGSPGSHPVGHAVGYTRREPRPSSPTSGSKRRFAAGGGSSDTNGRHPSDQPVRGRLLSVCPQHLRRLSDDIASERLHRLREPRTVFHQRVRHGHRLCAASGSSIQPGQSFRSRREGPPADGRLLRQQADRRLNHRRRGHSGDRAKRIRSDGTPGFRRFVVQWIAPNGHLCRGSARLDFLATGGQWRLHRSS